MPFLTCHFLRRLSASVMPETMTSFQEKLMRLRSATNLPLLRCRRALIAAEGDEIQARSSLFAELTTTEGQVPMKRPDGNSATRDIEGGFLLSGVWMGRDAITMLQLRFASDFGSRSELSRTTICKLLALANTQTQEVSKDTTIDNMLRSLSAQLREQLSMIRMEHIALTPQTQTACYVHPPLTTPSNENHQSLVLGERIVSILEFTTSDSESSIKDMDATKKAAYTIMRRVCQQFAAEGSLVQAGAMATFLDRPFLFAPDKSIRAALAEVGITSIRRAFRFNGVHEPLCITSDH